MNNKNKKSDLQFTELKPSDVIMHEDIYTESCLVFDVRGEYLSCEYFDIYINYAAEELVKAKQLFWNTFK